MIQLNSITGMTWNKTNPRRLCVETELKFNFVSKKTHRFQTKLHPSPGGRWQVASIISEKEDKAGNQDKTTNQTPEIRFCTLVFANSFPKYVKYFVPSPCC